MRTAISVRPLAERDGTRLHRPAGRGDGRPLVRRTWAPGRLRVARRTAKGCPSQAEERGQVMTDARADEPESEGTPLLAEGLGLAELAVVLDALGSSPLAA